MHKDEFIALGLRRAADIPSKYHQLAIDRLLTLLGEAVAIVDVPDKACLCERVEACRLSLAAATSPEELAQAIEPCVNECRRALAVIDAHRAEERKEVASLVGLVREALALVSGGAEEFSQNVGDSMDRFAALVLIDDVRQLKQKLVEEVTVLRQIAVERQQTWSTLAVDLRQRVETLEAQLSASRVEAQIDPLTRVLNRRAFDQSCQELLKRSHGRVVLALVDIDHFKRVNDTHGHLVGDRVLTAVAQALQGSVRVADVVARIGGDEFALLALDLNLRQAETRLKMVATSLAGVDFDSPVAEKLRVTLSCGVVTCSAGDTVQSLLERADSALYEAKRLGRNRVVSREKPTIRDLRAH
jgi:diguanylate cyclase